MRKVNACVEHSRQDPGELGGNCCTQMLTLMSRVARLEGQVQIITVLLGYLAILATAAVGYLLRLKGA